MVARAFSPFRLHFLLRGRGLLLRRGSRDNAIPLQSLCYQLNHRGSAEPAIEDKNDINHIRQEPPWPPPRGAAAVAPPEEAHSQDLERWLRHGRRGGGATRGEFCE